MLRIFQTSPWVNISCLAVVHNYNDSLVIYQQSFSTSLIFQFVSPHDISRVIVAEERNGSLAHHQIAICQRVWCFMQTKATSKAFSASQICWWLRYEEVAGETRWLSFPICHIWSWFCCHFDCADVISHSGDRPLPQPLWRMQKLAKGLLHLLQHGEDWTETSRKRKSTQADFLSMSANVPWPRMSNLAFHTIIESHDLCFGHLTNAIFIILQQITAASLEMNSIDFPRGLFWFSLSEGYYLIRWEEGSVRHFPCLQLRLLLPQLLV